MSSFSQRYGYNRPLSVDPPVRNEAPEAIRVGFIQIALTYLTIQELRTIVCKTLLKRPDRNNWSDPNVQHEVDELVYEAPWQKFYDIVEATIEAMDGYEDPLATQALNNLFFEQNVAWHIVQGKLELRTGEVTDKIVADAIETLVERGRTAAARELRGAVAALSHRPEPDTRDAVRRALGAMESVARDITGERTSTLGDILRHRGGELLQAPLPDAFSKIWGYASDRARHVDEEREPTLDEAILVVGLVGAAVAYLSRR